MNTIDETEDEDLEGIFGTMDEFIRNNCKNLLPDGQTKIAELLEEARDNRDLNLEWKDMNV